MSQLMCLLQGRPFKWWLDWQEERRRRRASAEAAAHRCIHHPFEEEQKEGEQAVGGGAGFFVGEYYAAERVHTQTSTDLIFEVYHRSDLLARARPFLLIINPEWQTGAAAGTTQEASLASDEACYFPFHQIVTFQWEGMWDNRSVAWTCQVMECDLPFADGGEDESEFGAAFQTKLAIYDFYDLVQKAVQLKRRSCVSTVQALIRSTRRSLAFGALVCRGTHTDDQFMLASSLYQDDEAKLASSLCQWARYLHEVQDEERAVAAVEEAVMLRRRDACGYHELAESLEYLAMLYGCLWETDKAIQLLEEAVDIARTAPEPEHASIQAFTAKFARLEAQRKEWVDFWKVLEVGISSKQHYDCLHCTFSRLCDQRYWGDSWVDFMARALPQLRRVFSRDPILPKLLHRLTKAYMRRGHFSHAIRTEDECLRLKAIEAATDPADLADSYQTMGLLHFAMGSPQDHALGCFRGCLAVLSHLHPLHHPALIEPLYLLGTVLAILGRTKAALHLLKAAVDMAKEYWGADHGYFPDYMLELVTCYISLGEFREAALVAKEVVELCRVRQPSRSNQQDTIVALEISAMIHHELEEKDMAKPLLKETIALRRRLGYDASAIHRSSQLQSYWGNEILRKHTHVLLGTLEAQKRQPHNDIPASLLALSAIFDAQKEDQRSLALLKEAYAMVQHVEETRQPILIGIEVALAMAYQVAGESQLEASMWEASWLECMKCPSRGIEMTRLMHQWAKGQWKRWERWGGPTEASSLSQALVAYKQVKTQMEAMLGHLHPDVAIILQEMSQLYQQQGQVKEAVAAVDQAVAVWRGLFTATTSMPTLAKRLISIATMYRKLGQYHKVMPLLEEARVVFKGSSKRHLKVLRKIVDAHQDIGQATTALKMVQDALVVANRDMSCNPEGVAGFYYLLGEMHERLGEQDQAVRALEQAISLTRVKFTFGKIQLLAGYLCRLGELMERMGEKGQALTLLEEALDLEIKHGEPGGAAADEVRATMLMAKGEYSQAVISLEAALPVARTNERGPYGILRKLATVYSLQGLPDKALPLLRKVLSIMERSHGPHHLDIAPTLVELAYCRCSLGLYDQALDNIRRALGIRLKNLTSSHLLVQELHVLIGHMYYAKGDGDRARRAVNDCHKNRLEALSGVTATTVSTTACDLAERLLEVCINMEMESEALELNQASLEARRRAQGAGHKRMIPFSLARVAYLQAALTLFDKAIPTYEEAVSLLKDVEPKPYKVLIQCLIELVTVYEEHGEHEKALKGLEEFRVMIGEESKASLTPLPPGSVLNKIVIMDIHRAVIHSAMGDGAQLTNQAVARVNHLLSKRGVPNGKHMAKLAKLLVDKHREKEAIRIVEDAILIVRSWIPVQVDEMLSYLCLLARLYKRKSPMKAAILVYEALHLRKTRLGPGNPKLIRYLTELAHDFEATGNLKQAVELVSQAVTIAEGRDPPGLISLLIKQAVLEHRAGDLKASLSTCTRVITMVTTHRKLRVPLPLYAQLAALAALLERMYEVEKERTLLMWMFKSMVQTGAHNQPTVTFTAISVLERLADLFVAGGNRKQACQCYDRALTVLRRATQVDDGQEVALLCKHASLHEAGWEGHASAIPLLREALTILDKACSHDGGHTAGVIEESLSIMRRLAKVYRKVGGVEAILPRQEKIVGHLKARQSQDPQPQHLREVILVMTDLSTVYEEVGRFADALRVMKEVIIHRRSQSNNVAAQAGSQEEEGEMAFALLYLARLNRRNNDMAQASENVLEAIQIGGQAMDHGCEGYGLYLSRTCEECRAVGMRAKAIELLEGAVKSNDVNPDLLTDWLLQLAGDYQQMEVGFPRVLAVLERVLAIKRERSSAGSNGDKEGLLDCLALVAGKYYEEVGDSVRARDLYEESLAVMATMTGCVTQDSGNPPHPAHYPLVCTNLAAILYDSGDTNKALELLGRALAVRREHMEQGGSGQGQVVELLQYMGRVHMSLGEQGQAKSCYEEALALQRQLVLPSSSSSSSPGALHGPALTTSLYSLASIYQLAGDYRKSIQLLEEAIGMLVEHTSAGGGMREGGPDALVDLSVCLTRLGDAHEALAGERSGNDAMAYHQQAQDMWERAWCWRRVGFEVLE